MPDDIWHSWLCVYFRNRALPTQEAHDCAHEAFLRYTQHAEAPAWNDGNPPALLWQIAHDVLCEYCRQRDRHARLQQRLIEHQRCVPPCDVEEMAIDAVECERFMAFLPGRLREVLQLRLQGYTYADIAQALSLSQGTVKSYGAQLREKFRKYFGYDPTKSPSRIGNIHGGLSEEALPLSEKEEVDDAQGTGMDSGGAVRGKRVRSAPHARRARTVRGGGDGSGSPHADE
jgi:RNA polymerase sigma factor (sigma-70 family)